MTRADGTDLLCLAACDFNIKPIHVHTMYAPIYSALIDIRVSLFGIVALIFLVSDHFSKENVWTASDQATLIDYIDVLEPCWARH